MIEFVLPLPPSVNSCYGGGSGQRRFKTRAYKDWSVKASLLLNKVPRVRGQVYVVYGVYFPDKKKRDLSNYIKCCEDAIVSAGILSDDNHTVINGFFVCHSGYDRKNPRIKVAIRERTSQE